MKIRIVSDGVFTKVLNVATGEELENVRFVSWVHHAGEEPRAALEVFDVTADVVVDGTLTSISIGAKWTSVSPSPLPTG